MVSGAGGVLVAAALVSCSVSVNGEPLGSAPPPSTGATSAAAPATSAVDFDLPAGWQESEGDDISLPPGYRLERLVLDPDVGGFTPNVVVTSQEGSGGSSPTEAAESFLDDVRERPDHTVVDEPTGTAEFDGVEGVGLAISAPAPGSGPRIDQWLVVLDHDGRRYEVTLSAEQGYDRADEVMQTVQESWRWR